MASSISAHGESSALAGPPTLSSSDQTGAGSPGSGAGASPGGAIDTTALIAIGVSGGVLVLALLLSALLAWTGVGDRLRGRGRRLKNHEPSDAAQTFFRWSKPDLRSFERLAENHTTTPPAPALAPVLPPPIPRPTVSPHKSRRSQSSFLDFSSPGRTAKATPRSFSPLPTMNRWAAPAGWSSPVMRGAFEGPSSSPPADVTKGRNESRAGHAQGESYVPQIHPRGFRSLFGRRTDALPARSVPGNGGAVSGKEFPNGVRR